MTISEKISDWEEWTGLRFFQSGKYVINGALKPIEIDIDKNKGEYIEPNIWVLHKIKK